MIKSMIVLVISLAISQLANCQVPLRRLDFRQQFNATDFEYDLKNSVNTAKGPSGSIRIATVKQMPSLSGEGLSLGLLSIDPCGINLPHHHPRATEMIYIIKGKNLRSGLIEENSGRTMINDIREGQVSIHFQLFLLIFINKSLNDN